MVVSTGNPWLTTDPQTSRQASPLPGTPPSVPLDVEPFTEDFQPLPNDSDDAKPSSSKSAITLSDEQQHILDLIKQGKNIFFTGSAGEHPGSHLAPDSEFYRQYRNREISPIEGNNHTLRWRCL
jgi:hypothetical protein